MIRRTIEQHTSSALQLALRHQHKLRFLVAGGVNTLVGLSLFPLLLLLSEYLRRHYLVALGLAQVASLVFAFVTYKVGVFRSSERGIVREFGTFASFYLVNYAANWVALPLLVEAAGISPIVAQIGFSLILMTGSWFWHSRVTFRANGKPQ